MSFALIVKSKHVAAFDKSTMTAQGEEFWVTVEPEGWVEASSSRCFDRTKPPGDPKLFANPEEAHAFARRWKGHPWWCQPDGGEGIVVEVKPRYVPVLAGWEVV